MTRLIYMIACSCAIYCGAFLNAQDQVAWTSLSGHVYTFEGRPLPNAIIEVFPLETAISGPLPIARSDEEGVYRLHTPSFGLTRICARLERLGYPDTRDKVFAAGSEVFPEVRLTAAADLKNVDIHLGPPDGFVEGTVVDKETQNVVRFARITMRWAEEPSVMYSSNIPQTGVFQ